MRDRWISRTYEKYDRVDTDREEVRGSRLSRGGYGDGPFLTPGEATVPG